MDNTTYVGMSHQMALRRQLDLVANNIANMNTTGYKRENVIFQEYMEKLPSDEAPATRSVDFVLDYGTVRDATQGEFVPTNNPLDLAIGGAGYFAVRDDAGNTLYTRNGHFHISPDGFLAAVEGHKVLGAGGQPIPIPPQEGNAIVKGDGTISTDAGVKGRVEIHRFADDRALTKIGDSYMKGDGAEPVPAAQAKINPGVIEGSNVKPVVELTEMIRILRTYQSTASMLDRFDDMRRKGVERLGRVN